ncbi:ATP-binding protein [Rugosimonospora acidiphila]
MRLLTATDLDRVRQAVTSATRHAGLDGDRATRLTLAVNEIATNAIRHGGGSAGIVIRATDGRIEVEIEDSGPGIPPGVTATRPEPEATGGRGLWLADQLCDEMQVRTGPTGTRICLVMRIR